MTLNDTALRQAPQGISLSEHGLWKERNAEGLARAARGAWTSASEAFAEALTHVDALTANDAVTLAARDNSRAKVLLNLAQSHFHSGALPDARKFAERSLAIRVGLYGEDSLVVARTRSDLAVILGALGERDEASSVLDRAVSVVERRPGEQSAQLIPVLTSTARILAESARASSDAIDESAGAEQVEARLDALVRQQTLADAELAAPIPVPEHSFPEGVVLSGNDDQPLRAAIAETANLLRKTPPSNVAINVNLDDAVFDLIEPPPPTLNSVPPKPPANATLNPLGFEVQYGIPRQLHEPLSSDETVAFPQPDPSATEGPPERPATPPRSVAASAQSARVPGRVIGGNRSGRTRVATPKMLWYIIMALLAFSAGAVAWLLVSLIG